MTMTAPTLASTPPRRWLFPKEHGAYVQLAVPLIAALVWVRGAPWGFSVATAACLFFVAHEPLLILLGQRGERIRQRDGAQAKQALTVRAGLAALLMASAVVMGETRLWLSLILPALLGGALLGMVQARKEKSTQGEVLAPLALSAWALPVAATGDRPLTQGLALALLLGLTFAAPVLAFRAVIAGNKPKARKGWIRLKTATGIVLCGAGAAAIATWAGFGLFGALAATPVLAVSALYITLLPHPRALTRLGWVMACASLATPTLLLIGAW
jgi:hypothetical protein